MTKVYTLFFACNLLFVVSSKAQVKTLRAGGFEFQMSTVDTTLNAEFNAVGVMPQFPGGMTELVAFAKRKIHYPKSAINDNVEGDVILQFVIDKKGNVTNKEIARHVRDDLDTVCFKMLNQMPKWKPARLNNKPLAMNLKWTIKFVLTD